LPYRLHFLLAGLLLALHLLEVVGELVQAGDGVAEIASDDLDLGESGFEGGLIQ
jgi:hypothetical protein